MPFLRWCDDLYSELLEFAYHRAVFEDGLTDAQRGVLREVARGASLRDENVDLMERWSWSSRELRMGPGLDMRPSDMA